MQIFDLVFIGNGSISLISALKLKKKFPKKRIALIGPNNMRHSASVAAGAMHAVFCEIEETIYSDKKEQDIFQYALESKLIWHELLETFDLKECITANSTIMYQRLNGTNFEKNNFKAACNYADKYSVLEDITRTELDSIFQGELKSDQVIAKKFNGEFSFDTQTLFKSILKRLNELNVIFIDDEVKSINRNNGGVEILTFNNKCYASEKIVLAAGSETSNLLKDEKKMIPIFHAVGTALVLDKAPSTYLDINSVIRTPNRGGAQCGLHLVPRNGGKYYLGASNYITSENPSHRIESIRYLINLCEEELYGKKVIYETRSDIYLGARAKSLDGYPLLGKLSEDSPEIFIASGFYRIGFTLSPFIANQIICWYENGEISKNLDNWSPCRKPNSYSSLENATNYYSESRVSNLIEHGLLDKEDHDSVVEKKEELIGIAKEFNNKIVQNLGLEKEFVVEPDMYQVLSEKF